jgi:hypothetical protein
MAQFGWHGGATPSSTARHRLTFNALASVSEAVSSNRFVRLRD